MRTICLCVLILLAAGFAQAENYELEDIVVVGASRVAVSSIRAVIDIEIDADRPVTSEEIDQAIRDIYALNRFDDISAEIIDGERGQILSFTVVERPLLTEVKIEGFDEIDEEELRELVTIKTPALYDDAEVQQTIDAFLQAYIEEGHRTAKIEPLLDVDDGNEAVLTLKIDEGENILVGKISFVGNHAVAGDDLEDVIETRERWWLSWLTGRGTFREDMAQNDVMLIVEYYHDRGYMDVDVLQPQIALNDEEEYLEIVFEIHEGLQYQVGTLDISGDLLETKETLMAQVVMEPAAVFNRSELRRSVLALTDFYADQGYAYVNVAPLTRKNRELQRIDLTFDIEQGPLVHIDRIEIKGNTRTRDKVIRRQLELAEGDLYSATKLRQSRRSVRNLGFFESVSLRDSQSTSPSLANLEVEVVERPTGTFTLGAGYSSVDHFVAQGSISQDNFRGYGVKLDLAASLGGASTTYRVGVTDPYFLDSKWSLGFDVYKREQDWSDFSERTTGGALRAGYPLARDVKGFLTYRYEDKEIYDVTSSSLLITEQEGESTLSSVTASVTRNSTDYYQDPSSGGISKVSFEYAGLGGTEHFAKSIGSHRHFWPAFWGTVVSLHGQMAFVAETTDDAVPIDEKFFLGGLRSIRGFETREVGPQDENTGDFVGGNKSAYFNLEYLFPISKSMGLKGVLFADTGNAWAKGEDYFRDMRYSAGWGVRWFSPLGPLRFEWGYNLDPRDEEKNTVFEFSIGTAF